MGAITAAISWTQPSFRALAASSGPHSHSTWLQPRSARASSRALGVQLASSRHSRFVCSRPIRSRRVRAAGSAWGPWATSVGARDVSQSWAVAGRSKLRLSTTRRGSGLRRPRLVSRGLSARTVPPPTITASHWLRSWCTHRRASGPLIHWLAPLLRAVRPSAPMAHLRMARGRPVARRCRKARLRLRASASHTPWITAMPAACSWAMPPPATWGLGSAMAITTCWRPAAITASLQGGVRPWWQQGSSVTTKVPPRARSPAWRRAPTSAWGPPAWPWKPSPTSWPPASSTTAPTMGLGLVRPLPRAANCRARRIQGRQSWCAGVGSISQLPWAGCAIRPPQTAARAIPQTPPAGPGAGGGSARDPRAGGRGQIRQPRRGHRQPAGDWPG